MSLASEALCTAMETAEQAVNLALRLDPDTLRALAQLHGKVIAVEVEGLGLTLYCLPGPTGMTLLTHYSGAADTVLRGRPLALLQLAQRRDASTLLFQGDIRIHGDIELGQRFKAILQRAQLDAEEVLAKVSGDVIAHQSGVLWRECQRWWQASRTRLARDAVDYLQYEQQVLPQREHVNTFSAGVEALRDDVARLAARIERLRSRLSR
jgi:ubiquinone biosynthesis accessory factor UbiJ